jgi:hypothetical protein
MKQRRALNAVAIVFAVHGMVSGNFATRLPWLADRLKLDAGTLGVTMLCMALGAAVVIPPAGKLVSRFGGRATTRTSVIVYCAWLAVPAFTGGFVSLCISLCCFGALAGSCDVAMKAQGNALEISLGRPIMSRLFGMWSLGALAGAGTGTLATFAQLDARLHLAWVAVALLVLAAITGVALPRTTTLPPAAPLPPTGDAGAAPATSRTRPSRALLSVAAIGFCAAFGEAAAHSWSAVYIAEVTGGGPSTASFGFAGFVACMAAGRLSGDALVQRLGSVRTVQSAGLLAIAGGTLVVTAAVPLVALTGFAMLGLGIAVILPVALSSGARLAAAPSQGLAVVLVSAQLACMACPAAIGGVAQTMSLPAAFALTVAVIVPVVLLAGVLRPAEAARPAPVRAIEAAPADVATLADVAALATVTGAIGSVPLSSVNPMTAMNDVTTELPVMSRHDEDAISDISDVPVLVPA